jgi:hypothetical protein
LARKTALGKIGVGLSRHGRADELLNFLILLDRRIDQVDPDRARRDLRVGRFEQRALDRCRRGAVARRRRLHNSMDNDHGVSCAVSEGCAGGSYRNPSLSFTPPG